MPAKEEIDRIVREVMRRLAAAPGAVEESQPPPARGRLRIRNGVVSLAAIEGRLEQVRQLVVSPRSVVTPSVRDVLRKRDIELVRDPGFASPPGGVAPRLLVANESEARIEQLLAELPSEVCLLRGGSCRETIATMATELQNEATLGLVITTAPEATVCVANRNVHLRALHGVNAASVERAVATMAANLLVLGWREPSRFESCNLVRTFLNTPRQIATAFQAALP